MLHQRYDTLPDEHLASITKPAHLRAKVSSK